MREFIGRPAEPRGRDARKQVESKPRKAADATTHRLEAEEPKARTKAPRKLINDNSDEETPQSRSAKRDRQVDDPNQGKLPFLPAPKPLPRRTRHSGATINYDESEPETSVAIAPAKPKPVSRFKGNRSDLLFPYPTTGRAEVTITVGDAQRIETGEFLNDTLLEFGLRKMLDELNVEIQSTIHLFNSFFYERLADRSKRPEKDQEFWPGYQSVRKWSKGKDIFEKDFIVVPINENFHWYLAVIVNPKGILRPNAEGNSSMPDSNAHRPVTRALAENDAGDASSVEEQLTAPGNRTDEDLNDLDSEAGDAKTQRSQGTPPLFDQPNSATSCQSTDVDMNDVNDISKDPLDCIDDDDNEGIRNGQPEHTAKEAMREVSTGVGNMDINSDQETEPDLVGEGGPIISTTLQAIAQQNSHLQNPTTEKIGTGHSQVRTKHPDAEIADRSHRTWIITFDSLGGPHAAVGKHLNSWLRYEAKDKKGIDYKTSDAVYWEGRVPQQPNFYDCGIYVVHYAKQFLQNPTKILQFVQRRAPYSNAPDREAWIQERAEVWNASDTENMRSTWEGQLQSLAEQYQLFKASQPPDEVSKDNEQPDDMPVENLEQQQGRIVNSQPESILLVPDANGHELPSEEEPNFDPIPGAFPTPVTQQPEPPKAQSPSPPATKPKWSTTPSDDQRGRRRSSTVDIDPKIKTSTKSESLSPAPSDHEILQGTFTSVHDKKAHTSPSFRSIDTGIVQNRRHAFESTQYRTEGPITRQRNAISTSPIRKGRASEEGETAYREVEHLRPRRNPLADLDTEDSPPASSSTLNAGLLPSGLSGSEDPILLPRNNNFHVTSSPFDNLGRFVPGQPSNQQERIEPAHPPKDPLDFDNSEQALDDDQVFVASDISQHLGQKDKSPTSLTSDEEEQEPIENLPAKASPIVKHQYSSKSKSIKRMLSTEKSQSKLPVTKKPKTAISTTKGSTKGKGPNKQGFGRGTTKEEAIDIESD
uniref:Ubiquitin-like protease family profile domain-containing protein n=1 Tax=Kwoniella pini CBS 10737 TaxID=1296096 RepID=A0A1B9HVR2_9TREE|nr:uncharacterized protein I206_06258 [Kwoniella pini CBS 10737]OCF47362.1 hypothetical protein I206_06258 [Kwoniella pini CBS 10737]